jgi:hypothetical protein
MAVSIKPQNPTHTYLRTRVTCKLIPSFVRNSCTAESDRQDQQQKGGGVRALPLHRHRRAHHPEGKAWEL